MNKPDSFVMMCALMSDKLVNQATKIADLEDHIVGDHAEMDSMQRTITDLRRQLEDRYEENYNKRRCEDLERINSNLYEEVRKLRIKLYGMGEGGANAYMVAEGKALWGKGEKIATIKGVRECTGWGLKETKDWCESYMEPKVVPSLDMKEEAPSGTKRSSQLPQGVGIIAKKSA